MIMKKILFFGAFAAFVLTATSCCRQPEADNQNQLLLATAWYQQSAEMRACYYQAYRMAQMALDNNLSNYKGDKRPAVVPVRCSVWPGRRFHRRGCQSLCGESLSIFRDELPSLFLWRRRDDQPVHHVSGAEGSQMERGISMDCLYPDGHPAGVYPVSATLEAE